MFAVLGILFGLVFLQVSDDDLAGMSSKLSVIFMTTGFCGVLHAGTSFPLLFRWRAVFYREQSSNTYSPWVYALANTLVELPYVFVFTLVFVVPCYHLVGFQNDGELFFRYAFSHYLMSLCFLYLGHFLASALPNAVVAQILQGVLYNFCFLFGGVFIQGRFFT